MLGQHLPPLTSLNPCSPDLITHRTIWKHNAIVEEGIQDLSSATQLKANIAHLTVEARTSVEQNLIEQQIQLQIY